MNCKNCQLPLPETGNYCLRCGAKVIRNRLTLKNLFASFSEQFLNYDNKFLQTFITLFKKPEDVIDSYINGTRKKYVNVVSYFAIAITLSGLQIYVLQKFPMDVDLYLNPDPIIAKWQKKFNDSMFQTMSEYQSIIMMLYIPFYALISKLIFYKNRTLNYTESLVLYMYAQAQLSIALAVISIVLIPLGVSFELIGFLIFPIYIFYFAYCLKGVYRLTLAQIVLKTLIFLILLGVIFFLVMIGGMFYAYKAGIFDEIREAQKTAKDSIGFLGNFLAHKLHFV